MWPARMFAHSRMVSESSRIRVEITSIGKIRSSIGPWTPAGIRLFRYPIGPCVPDAHRS